MLRVSCKLAGTGSMNICLFLADRIKLLLSIMKGFILRLIILLPVLSLQDSKPAIAQKTDRIMTQNGDWITGEIKTLDLGMLTYKTDAAGTLSVKWEQIRHIVSDKTFALRLSNGESYTGSFEPTDNSYEVRLTGEADTVIDMNYIVEVTALKRRFWARLDGSFDFGFSFTKASQVRQTNMNFQIEHRGIKTMMQLNTSLINTFQPEQETARLFNAGFRHRYYFRHNFALENTMKFQRNTELDLGLRTGYGAGPSKNWIRSNTQRLYTGIGPLINAETSISNPGYSYSLESFLYAEHRIYRYRDPELYITTTYIVYPSLSNPGRVRWDLHSQVRYEVFNNFFVGLTFYHTYDNQPVSEVGSNSDWGITTSIGYTF